MGNTLTITTPTEYITFISQHSTHGNTANESVKIPWSMLRDKFRRFSDDSYRNSNVIVNLPIRSFRRLSTVLMKPGMAILEASDVELLNWLELKDFTDAYKLYAVAKSSIFAPPFPVDDNTYTDADAGGDGIMMQFKRM